VSVADTGQTPNRILKPINAGMKLSGHNPPRERLMPGHRFYRCTGRVPMDPNSPLASKMTMESGTAT